MLGFVFFATVISGLHILDLDAVPLLMRSRSSSVWGN